MTFQAMRNTGKLIDSPYGRRGGTLLLVLNRTTVDYFSLDVEGPELQVLKIIPFDKVDIKVLTVEFLHTKEGKVQLQQFMLSKEYSSVMEILHPGGFPTDIVFVKQETCCKTLYSHSQTLCFFPTFPNIQIILKEKTLKNTGGKSSQSLFGSCITVAAIISKTHDGKHLC